MIKTARGRKNERLVKKLVSRAHCRIGVWVSAMYLPKTWKYVFVQMYLSKCEKAGLLPSSWNRGSGEWPPRFWSWTTPAFLLSYFPVLLRQRSYYSRVTALLYYAVRILSLARQLDAFQCKNICQKFVLLSRVWCPVMDGGIAMKL